MPRPFRFTVQGGTHLDAGRSLLADGAALPPYARKVESLGYQELYSYDHIGHVDPFAPLVVAASATERLRVGPLVLNNELHHPVLLARTAATVDRMTGGRLVLGLGTGYDESEHEAIGAPIRPPGARVSRFAESLAVLRALLDEGRADHDGEHHRVHVDDLGVRPVQERVPFLIGGHGPRVVRLAARYADIFQFTGIVHGEGGAPSGGGFAVPALVERARWLSEAAGERDGGIERSALVQFLRIGADAPSAEEVARAFELTADAVRDSPFALFGSVEQVVDKLQRLRELLGISHYVVRDPDAFAPVVEALSGR
ncbi:TIGR03621 family F420-dependent LLM class oxidoreductase [Pseudonocardia humida]|uniref:TIGR03621 family F420-dependent LLM class oxidoreductase n=1 Tax=Pseudonocardia humida TaxID=2800819 RepID=A0ABT1ACU9_9PSEU|nr:TIGR03621 family F420-dependent LLM class oxidoreductase [Pseudonocardia humida]MCO1660439.1 TIGR03621 family F420-dependent LLM class oxidoreductase [Pseudonocardia humida]